MGDIFTDNTFYRLSKRVLWPRSVRTMTLNIMHFGDAALHFGVAGRSGGISLEARVLSPVV